MRLRIITFASIAIAGMGIAFLSTPAQAQVVEKDRHCVADVSAPHTPTTCYDSFTVAIAKATDGRVTDAPDDARTATHDAHLTAQLTAMETRENGVAKLRAPISIMYDDADFRGSSLIYTGDRDCTNEIGDVIYSVALVRPEWNDRIGSYRAYRGCWLSLFKDLNWTGDSIPFAGDRTDVGFMDDETSSILWS